MQATLVSTHRPYANQGLVTVFGDKGSILSGDKVAVTAIKQANVVCMMDSQLITCELPPLAFAAAQSYTWSLTTWHKIFGH